MGRQFDKLYEYDNDRPELKIHAFFEGNIMFNLTRICAGALLLAAACGIAPAAHADAPTGMTPCFSVSLSVTSASANVALSASCQGTIQVQNIGTAEAFVNPQGASNAAAATTSNDSLPAGTCHVYQVVIGATPYLAAITTSGTATLRITQGSGAPTCTGGLGAGGTPAGPSSVTPTPINQTGSYHAATITASDTTPVAASTAVYFLDLRNLSPTATVCINFGATATITGTQCAAGEIAISPLANVSWSGNFVPADAVHAIASAASVPFTYGAK